VVAGMAWLVVAAGQWSPGEGAHAGGGWCAGGRAGYLCASAGWGL